MTQDMRHEPLNTTFGTRQHTNGSSRNLQKNGVGKGTNGYKISTNGVEHVQTNGHTLPKPKQRSQSFYGHDREEVTRLLIQGLEDLGYPEAAERLSEESGYHVESPAVVAFRNAILEGDWLEAESILFTDTRQPDGGGVSIRHGDWYGQDGLQLIERMDPHHLRFLIREQKYVELLRGNRRGEALAVLQSELQPLKHDVQRLNILSGLLVSEPAGDHEWGTLIDSRQRLLEDISKFISPSVMIPQHRLADLLTQVHQGQVSKCLYHNPSSSRPPSLFTDHICDQNDFPLRTSMELTQTDGEVWFVCFSHNGKYLAACGESRTVVIYDVPTFDVHHKLLEHDGHVVYVAWSPDDSRLITCCRDGKARIFDMRTARCMIIIDHHEHPVTSAAWSPDSQAIVTGSLDKHAQLRTQAADGNGETFNWPTALRTQDCAITPDGRKLIAMSTDNYITVYNFADRTEDYAIKVTQRMTCLSVSQDSKHMLVNMANDEVHLIDIASAKLVRKYAGQRQNDFIIRSVFGGADEGLIVSGSSDSKVYIWHKENGTLIESLEGHSHGCVNTVAWNPTNPKMFASGGDDKKVRIWTKKTESPALPRSPFSSNLTHRHSL